MNADILLFNDDVGCTDSGDIDLYIEENDAILQNAIENMRIQRNSIPITPNRGNAIYSRRLKFTDNDMKIVESDCRDAIMYDTRVKSIPSMVVTRMSDGSANVQFSLMKHDGTIISGFTKIKLGGNG